MLMTIQFFQETHHSHIKAVPVSLVNLTQAQGGEKNMNKPHLQPLQETLGAQGSMQDLRKRCENALGLAVSWRMHTAHFKGCGRCSATKATDTHCQ